MKLISNEPGKNRQMISASDLAGILGLTPDSVYRLLRRGIIPGYRIGRTVRFDLERVEAALSANPNLEQD